MAEPVAKRVAGFALLDGHDYWRDFDVSFRFSVAFAWLMVFASMGAFSEPAPDSVAATEPTAQILERVVSHRQSWGALGVDECVHAPGSVRQPLQIGDTVYEHGLGSHANQETVIQLEGHFLRFEAEVGVQKQAQGTGSVVFSVLVDGEEVFDSGLMREASPAIPVSVDLKGARTVTLRAGEGGDGFTCDCANWAMARLVVNPENPLPPEPERVAVDIAPFAEVVTSDPARNDGARNTRLEPWAAEDLFLQTSVERAGDAYPIPAYANTGCIGLRWLEHRLVNEIALRFAGAAPALGTVRAEYWDGLSRWQGEWKPFDAAGEMRDGWLVFPVEMPPLAPGYWGTLQVRWVFDAPSDELAIDDFRAVSANRWSTAKIHLEVATPVGAVDVRVRNGEILSAEDAVLTQTWDTAAPLTLDVRYVPDRLGQGVERTTLEVALPDGQVVLAMRDLVTRDAVYVPEAALCGTLAPANLTLAEYKNSIADKQTILEAVRTMPDQTFENAMAHVLRPRAEEGPTLLSLACDNRKFLLQRSGEIAFSDRPEKYNVADKSVENPFNCRVTPAFGNGTAFVSRQLTGGWYPIPVITFAEDDVVYTQTTFVAPHGEAVEGMPAWWNEEPLGVAAFTVKNTGAASAESRLTLNMAAGADGSVAPQFEQRGDDLVVLSEGHLLAVLRVEDGASLTLATVDGAVTLSGELPAGAETRCALYMPRWDAQADALPSADDASTLSEKARAYWDAVMAPAMSIETPDPLLNNIIRASQVHCMLAARNEHGETIAPWIGSIHYGPLESEGHSIIRGMQFMGHEDFARRALDFYIARYNEDGFLTTGYTLMGTGWHLWTLGEWMQLYADDAWLRENAEDIARVCRWIVAQRAMTQHTDAQGVPVPESGLMPPGPLADWNLYAYYFYLNGYYCAGLEGAAEALQRVGHPEAPEFLQTAAEFREDIVRAFHRVQSQAPVMPVRDGTAVAAYPTQLYCPAPIGDFFPGDDSDRSWCYDVELGAHHLVPMGILPPDAPSVGGMMDHMEDVQFLRDGWHYYPASESQADWFNLGGFAKVQPYYARTVEVYALRDDVKPFVRSYFNTIPSLLNPEDLSLWEHFFNGAFNKTHETGYLLHQSALMFVQTRGNELWLAPFVTGQWLHDGQQITVVNAPTPFGRVGYTIESHVAEGHIDAHIQPPAREQPEAIVLRLRHPEALPIQSVTVNGKPHTNFDAQTVRLNGDVSAMKVVAAY